MGVGDTWGVIVSGAEPNGDDHYGLDVVGARRGMAGGGLHVYLTGDLLHPPMVADARIWADGSLWAMGAAAHTRAIAQLAELSPGECVLDVGCGIGGPARLMVREFGVSVAAVTNSATHAETCRTLNAAAPDWRERIAVAHMDGQHSLPPGPYHAAVSINMLYQVPDHRALFARVYDRLLPGGRFVIDDWMLTSRASSDDIGGLSAHFAYTHFGHVSTLESELMAVGFPPAEKILDFGDVGRGPMAEHFERQMREHFAPRIVTDWPGDPERDPGRAAYGLRMVEEFVAAVNLELALYRERRMTYRRLLVRKNPA
jgi:SAM-dependent methyltransferase